MQDLFSSFRYPGKNLIAIDCEMVTMNISIDKNDVSKAVLKQGLARVSIVNHDGNLLLDTFVAPKHEVIDYKTELNGITQESLQNAPSFDHVQTKVLEILESQPFVVGQSVHFDFAALEIAFPIEKIKDTAEFFRRFFPGCKCPKLKHLANWCLGLEIQSGAHDSIIDASAALLLYLQNLDLWEEIFPILAPPPEKPILPDPRLPQGLLSHLGSLTDCSKSQLKTLPVYSQEDIIRLFYPCHLKICFRLLRSGLLKFVGPPTYSDGSIVAPTGELKTKSNAKIDTSLPGKKRKRFKDSKVPQVTTPVQGTKESDSGIDNVSGADSIESEVNACDVLVPVKTLSETENGIPAKKKLSKSNLVSEIISSAEDSKESCDLSDIETKSEGNFVDKTNSAAEPDAPKRKRKRVKVTSIADDCKVSEGVEKIKAKKSDVSLPIENPKKSDVIENMGKSDMKLVKKDKRGVEKGSKKTRKSKEKTKKKSH